MFISSVQSLSCVRLFETPWTAAHQASLSITNSYPFSRWYHPTILSFVAPFSSCPQSFPASGSFQMSQLFASVSQSIGTSGSASVLPMNTQNWSPLGWTGWISLQETRVQSLAWGYPTCCKETKSMLHNYWACTLRKRSCNYWSLYTVKSMFHNMKSHCNEKAAHCNEG